jgi:hypothetical protein
MPLYFTDLTPRQMRAIKNMTDKGLVLQISTLPTITFIQKDTGEVCIFTIEELCEEYDYDRKEEARARKTEQFSTRSQAGKRLTL